MPATSKLHKGSLTKSKPEDWLLPVLLKLLPEFLFFPVTFKKTENPVNTVNQNERTNYIIPGRFKIIRSVKDEE
jgi:hypothetical protein